ncbi:MAG: tRNA (adenine(22)-N(1))-methyltransferase [Anaerovoracaceae bacterium]|jgi:tRNA (adenine22-N1)-methyltransferase
MINLSSRLRRIAEEVKPGETVADIGTDHGYLPIYLVDSGISPRAILTDISPGSLEKAKRDAESFLERSGRVSFRLGDGLDVIAPGEVDVIVIAGMGGLQMIDILGREPQKSRSFSCFLLQPRTKSGELRAWLRNHGCEIRKEQIVREGKHLPVILTAVYTGNPDPAPYSAEDDFPGREAVNAGTPEPLIREFFEREQKKYEAILRSIRTHGSDETDAEAAKERLRVIETRIGEMV